MLTSVATWPSAAIISCVVSVTPAVNIHQPVEHASTTDGNRDMVLSSVDVTTWPDEAVLSPVVAQPWLREAQTRLVELGQLPNNWIGSEKPNEYALRVARALVDRMERLGHRVLHIAPIADGGLVLSYTEGERSAYFDVYNEGGIVVVTCSGSEAPDQFVELPEAEAAAALASFLQYDDATSAG